MQTYSTSLFIDTAISNLLYYARFQLYYRNMHLHIFQSEPSLVTHRHTTPPQQHKPSAGAQNAYSIKTHCRALHDSEYVENNTYDEEAEDDDDRGDFLLEQVHAQEGQQQSCKSGYQGIQVVLHCGDLGRIKGHA